MADSTPTPAQSLEAPFAVPVRVCDRSEYSYGAPISHRFVVDANEQYICTAPSVQADVIMRAINAYYSPAPTAPGEALIGGVPRDQPVPLSDWERMVAERDALREQLQSANERVAELEGQRRLWLDTDNNARVMVRQEGELVALREQLAGVRAALRKYGDHYPECDYIQTVGRGCVKQCSCGFLAALPASAAEGACPSCGGDIHSQPLPGCKRVVGPEGDE